VLAAVQSLAYDLGKERAASDSVFAGRSPAEIERECELFVTQLKYGSFEATLDVAEPPSELFADNARPALGPVVVNDLNLLADALGTGRPEPIKRVFADPSRRWRAIKALATSLPAPSGEYRVMWGAGSRETLQPLYQPSPEMLGSLAALPEGLAVHEKPDEEVVVEGTCVATLGKDGRPANVREWLDFSVLLEEDTRPYRTDRVAWRGRAFLLTHEIACSVTIEDHLVVIQYEPLGIRAYASTRDAAVRDFAEEFAFLWDDYAVARDEELTRRAAELKRRLRELVREVTSSEASEGGTDR